MDILSTILSGQNGVVVQQIAQRFGLSQDQAFAALSKLMPALSQGLQKNSEGGSTLDTLAGLMNQNNPSRYLEQPDAIQKHDPAEGNALLGQLLGGKEASRALAADVARQTGVSGDLLKSMLPVAASLFMGAVGKQAGAAGGGLASLLAGLSASDTGAGGGLLGTLTGMLDKNKDGSAIDDVLGMLTRKKEKAGEPA
jgi:hypothetical protein